MTVTELREALQRLEAEGHGGLDVVYHYEIHGNVRLWDAEEPKVEKVGKHDPGFEEDQLVVRL